MTEEERKFNIKEKENYERLCDEYINRSASSALLATLTGVISAIDFFFWGTALIDPELFKEILWKLHLASLSLPRSFFGWSGFFNIVFSTIFSTEVKQVETNRGVYLERLTELEEKLKYMEEMQKQKYKITIDGLTYLEKNVKPLPDWFTELQKDLEVDEGMKRNLKK